MPCARSLSLSLTRSACRTLWAWHAIVAPQKAKTTCKSGTCSVGIKWHVAAAAARTLIMMKKFHNTHWHTHTNSPCTHTHAFTMLYTQFICHRRRRSLTSIKIALAARRQ